MRRKACSRSVTCKCSEKQTSPRITATENQENHTQFPGIFRSHKLNMWFYHLKHRVTLDNKTEYEWQLLHFITKNTRLEKPLQSPFTEPLQRFFDWSETCSEAYLKQRSRMKKQLFVYKNFHNFEVRSKLKLQGHPRKRTLHGVSGHSNGGPWSRFSGGRIKSVYFQQFPLFSNSISQFTAPNACKK